MTEIYRKWGRVVRYENGIAVTVEEAGEAVEEGAQFRTAPIRGERRPLVEVAVAEVRAAAAAIEKQIHGLSIERLVLVDGVAIHEFAGRVWSERIRRMHLAVVKRPHRIVLDEQDFVLDSNVLAALERLDGERSIDRVVLAPRVSAVLLPLLSAELSTEQSDGPVEVDGKGAPIEATAASTGTPPNWFRPTYRLRPVRAWFNLRARPSGSIANDLPRAIALLRPPSGRTIEVLCTEGREVFRTTFHMGGVLAVGDTAECWYPYGPGAWGVDMLLESRRQDVVHHQTD
jgi:hypothetical protein